MLRPLALRLLAAALCLPFAVPVAAALEVRVEGAPPELAQGLAVEAQRAYEQALPWFGTGLTGPVTVEWVTDDATLRQRGGEPGVVSGLAIPAQGRVVLAAGALRDLSRVHGVLTHELCHLLFAAATDGAELAPPRWLDEGIAMWRSGEWDLGDAWQRTRVDLLTDAASAGAVVPLDHLDASFPQGPFFHVAYAQSLSFVEWLVQRDGDAALRTLLRRLDADEDLEPAFAAVYGIPLARAESDWSRSLGRSGWLHWMPSAPTLFTLLFVVTGLLLVVKYVRTRVQLRNAEDPFEEEL